MTAKSSAKNLCSNFAAEIKGKSLPLPLPRRGDSENRDVILNRVKDPALGLGQAHCEMLHYAQHDKTNTKL